MRLISLNKNQGVRIRQLEQAEKNRFKRNPQPPDRQ